MVSIIIDAVCLMDLKNLDELTQETLRSTVDNAEDVIVRYRAAEMCLLIDEIGKNNEFSYPLMLKTLDRVVVTANGKLTFIFQSGIKITV